MKKILQLEGLDCAACAAELEEEIRRIDGVTMASVAFVNQKLTVECEGEEVLQKVMDAANHFEEVKVVETHENACGKTVLHIENLDCPVCAEALQAELQKIKGVRFVSVDYVSQTITLETDGKDTIARVVKRANAFEEVRVLDGGRYALKKNFRLKEWLLIGVSALLFIVGLLVENFVSGKVGIVAKYALYAISYLLVGYPVLVSTVKNIAKGRIFDENFLMTVASIGAICIGETSEAVLVMLLYQLGELLQGIAVGASRRSVTELMELKSERAILLVNGEQKVITPEEVQVGDILLIKAGEKVPVDGVLLSETATFDTKSLTGESEPRLYQEGEELLSGCINEGGMVEMKATRPYSDSAVGKILEMVENASAGKAKPEKFITQFAKIYTPVVCCLALLIALCAPLIDGLVMDGSLYFKDFTRWLQSALTFLVISCPCALIISVPLTYFSGIGACAKNGILVKGAMYLEIAARVKTIAFDKTGTLTEGNFAIQRVQAMDTATEEEILALVATVEKGSAHPIARAFENCESTYHVDQVTELSGRGLIAEVAGETVLVGNEKLMTEQGVSFTSTDSVYTVIYVAKNGKILGAIEIGDKLREDAKTTIEELKKQGISRLVMLTGDRTARAQKIANEVGMYEVNADLLPGDKLKTAEKLKKNGALMYVGDGINDAPVMATADCAVSMGKIGSAAAVEASDLVLISDRLTAIPKAVRIAKKTRSVVMQNVIFSIAMKAIFMVLGVVGVLSLGLAVFADVGVMLLAVLNSFRVRLLKK